MASATIPEVTTTSLPALPSPQRQASDQHRIARLTGVQILSCGSYAPPRVVTNKDLAPLGYDADWSVQRTGILERRWATDNVAASDLAYEAAVRCLAAQ